MQIKSIQVETGKKKLEHARAEIQTLSHKVQKMQDPVYYGELY